MNKALALGSIIAIFSCSVMICFDICAKVSENKGLFIFYNVNGDKVEASQNGQIVIENGFMR